MPGIFSQHLLLCPLTVAVCSRWMLGVYENKRQESFPNVYCYVRWQSQFVLDGCLAFLLINARTLFPMSTAMALDSRSLFWWMPGIYENKYRLFSQHLLLCPLTVTCLAFMKINTRTLFPTSTAMSPDSHSLFSMDVSGVYENECQDSFPNIYCYVSWQSQFLLDGCLAFIKINTRTLFPMSTAISLDSRTLFSMDAWRLFSFFCLFVCLFVGCLSFLLFPPCLWLCHWFSFVFSGLVSLSLHMCLFVWFVFNTYSCLFSLFCTLTNF